MAATQGDLVLANYPNFKFNKEFIYIINLLHDIDRVKVYLALLKAEVIKKYTIAYNLTSDSNVSSGSLPDKNEKEKLLGIALHDVLCATEKIHGFSNEVWYLKGVLTTEEFFSMMTDVEPHPFIDPLVNVKHGAQVHRIQWWIICQEMDKGHIPVTEMKTKANNASILYRETSDGTAQVEGGNSGTTLWYKTFDNIQGGRDAGAATPRCPEWLTGYILTNYPDYLNPAEKAAQKWDDAPKATIQGYTKIGNAGFLTKRGNVKQKGSKKNK